ncbi:MAG TPA: PaaI family thioesterase [Bacillales bacterium]|nr:PaaI family thioesterase [Bacillales bacterium]
MAESLVELRKTYEQSPFFQHLGFEFVELEKGNVMVKLALHRPLLNTLGMLHGGIYATMIDNIIGITVRSITGRPLVTVQLNVHYLAPVGEGTIYAKGKVDRLGHRLITGEGEIVDEQGNVLAKGSGTFKQVRKG